MKKYRIAVVGATGMVGRTFVKILEEYNLPVSEYVLFASKRSAGNTIQFFGKDYVIQELNENSFDSGFDIALFSAGGSVSAKFAPVAASKGCVVIDNSSQWRMDPTVPLIVPEVNPEAIKGHHNIIANPNCSTIQAMLPLRVLQKKYGIRRIVYSTYQAVSGAGLAGWNDLVGGAKSFVEGTEYELQKFPFPIFSNCIPHIDVFQEDGYTKEEHKMMDETHKILGDNSIRITATTVRVPVLNGHSESINVELASAYDLATVKKELAEMEGLVVMDDPANNVYPMASISSGSNDVFVGRLRRDDSVENGLNMWVVADNIRKGAAANAVQIAKYMMEHEMV